MQQRLVKWNSTRRFGIEFEFMNPWHDTLKMQQIVESFTGKEVINQARYMQTNDNFNHWEIKRDASVSIELTTPIMSGPADLKVASEVIAELTKNGFFFSKKCGLHIHVDVSDYEKAYMDSEGDEVHQALVLAAYWIKMERAILNAFPKHRRGNKFCTMLESRTTGVAASAAYSCDDLRACFNDRRRSLNILPADSSRKTVEFRFGDMTDDANDIKNRVRFLTILTDRAKLFDLPSNLNWYSPLEVLKQIGVWKIDSNIIDLKFSPAIIDLKKWFLSKYIKNAPVDYAKDKEMCKSLLKTVEKEKYFVATPK